MRLPKVIILAAYFILPGRTGQAPCVQDASRQQPDRSYEVINLGHLTGCDETFAQAINNRGVVVGYSYKHIPPGHGNAVVGRAFVWDYGEDERFREIRPLRTLSGDYSHACAINARGDIVGDAERLERTGLGTLDTVQYFSPVLWLGRPGGYSGDDVPLALSKAGGTAFGINNKREIIGNDGRPFLWRAKKRTGLNVPKGSRLVAINDRGEVIGYTYSGGTMPLDEERYEHAFLWRDGKRTDLKSLGGKYCACAAINNQSVIVGWARTEAGNRHACLWKAGGISDLGTLGGRSSEAVAVDSAGVVAGYSLDGTDRVRACLWQDGKIVDLNTLLPPNSGWVLYRATGINEKGQIIGEGEYLDSGTSGFLLTPTTADDKKDDE
jgi:probable HAF family extracellular repeat protein